MILHLQSFALARYPPTGSSFIVCLYKSKGNALDRAQADRARHEKSWRGLWTASSESWCQFSFVSSRGTLYAISVVRQRQEKYLADKRLYLAFVDWVPRKVIWWALRTLGVQECTVRLVQEMYLNARSRVRVGEGYRKGFEVKVGVRFSKTRYVARWASLLCLTPSRELHSGVLWEDLYADDLLSLLSRSRHEVKVGVLFTKTRYVARWALSLCLKPCHASSALGYPGRTSIPMTLLSLLSLEAVSGGSWFWKKQWRRKGWE